LFFMNLLIISRNSCHTGEVNEGIGEIYPEDNSFPRSLIKVAPNIKKLWYRGTFDDAIFDKCVAVVGSRHMSRYGKQVISELVPRLILAGYSIVSGLMYGIDQEAHKIALQNNGKVIAVLGYGIDYDCEEGATMLANKIVENGGAILSEYAPGSISQRWMFPQRNRIVVGLAESVFIVEAGEKSGSLNTAEWAIKMKKKIYGVPGSMFSSTSMGINRLIASGQAKLLTMKEVEEWSGDASRHEDKVLQSHDELTTILKIDGPMSVNELSRKTGKSVGDLLAQLLQAELKGQVNEERSLWKVV